MYRSRPSSFQTAEKLFAAGKTQVPANLAEKTSNENRKRAGK